MWRATYSETTKLLNYLISHITMDIDVPLRELGAINATALRDAIFNQEDAAWYEDESRQKSFYMHDQTRSLVLLSLDDTKWPDRHNGSS